MSDEAQFYYDEFLKIYSDFECDEDVFEICYTLAYSQACAILDGVSSYLPKGFEKSAKIFLTMHYIIVNPLCAWLYEKYNIANKDGGIVSSASNSSSSASYQSIKSYNDADFLTLDLMRTPFGKFVYSLLEQLDSPAIVLL